MRKIKTYFNNAIIGNSRMLACLSSKGEIVRLFWPNIDYFQHVEKLIMGLYPVDRKHGTSWLGEDDWITCQSYIDDSNVLKTSYSNDETGMDVDQFDLVLPGEGLGAGPDAGPGGDVLIRHYEIKNRGSEAKETGFIVYSSFTVSGQDIRGSLFDFDSEALVHYRHGYYISISADRDVYQFQLGNNALDAASRAELYGADAIGMMADAALSWKLGEILPGETRSFTLYICASNTLRGVKELVGATKKYNWQEKYIMTLSYWKDFFNSTVRIDTGIKKIDTLYKRSLMVFKLMQNEDTGGLLAAPEVDEHFTRCGRYGYCWVRDAAFITEAMDRCGLVDAVDKFFDWAVMVQDTGGFWHQRYYLDGNLAPSWGLQVDETGTLIWGMLQHYKIKNDRRFLDKMWPSIEKGVDFLVSFIDIETGLPCPSYDLWEERIGEHTYSSAAVLGGIYAGIEIARILGLQERITCKWKETAEQIKKSILRVLWSEKHGRFLRSVRTKLNPWGAEHSENKALIKVNPKGYYMDVTLEDGTIDVSLLGVCVPFGILDEDNPMVESTVKAIEQALEFDEVGGIERYENDNYIGGNPWVVATLWLALYYMRKKEYKKAREHLYWAANSATELGFLPEQADRHTGKPAWVIPLTWSHAMFVLCLTEDEGFLSILKG